MDFLEALILGLVQGLTEFLPISSTAHLRVVPALLGWKDPGAAFSAIIQLGTTAAVIVYFAKDLWKIAGAFFGALGRRKPFETQEARLGWYIIIGTIPVGIAGLLLKDLIEGAFRSLYVIASAAIGLALLLVLAERLARHHRDLQQVTLRDSIAVGLAQAVALIPGASRSGVTLTAGLFHGLKRDAAARFSFLLSIPATVAAGVFEMRHLAGMTHGGLPIGAVVIGTLSSFVFGLAAIAGLLRYLQTHTTGVFIVYRIVLGVGILALVGWGILQP
ncbi:MAG TPA: undecaprenyl-diphosphatase [Myxococcales bacterium]|jgi:undecaprenyl-diphosphatase|nr:undecaprenyl-diphosphatase [Myxococcales bacterium]